MRLSKQRALVMADPSRTFIEIGPGMKDRIRHAVEALIDVPDSLDTDPDIEDSGDEHEPDEDEEPSLGATHSLDQTNSWRSPQTLICDAIDLKFDGNGVPESEAAASRAA